MSEIQTIAILYPRKEKRDRLKEVLTGLCKDVYDKEEGTIRYLMTEQIGSDDPSIVMIETFKDEEAMHAHHSAEHFKALFPVLEKEDLQEKPMYLIRTVNKAGYDLDRKLMSSKS